MTRETADMIGNALQDNGYDYARTITGDAHRIELLATRFEGKDLLTLMAILVPGGKPIPNVLVSLEFQRGLVIA